jgi:hypothetical protein
MTAKSEMLRVAAMRNGHVWTGIVCVDGDPFSWETGVRRLEVVCLSGNGCSYAEARLSDQDKQLEEIKRLSFYQNNTVGEFKVRVYRTEISSSQAHEDFLRPVEPAKPQGMV